jgi:hypothetical protein
MTLTWKDAAATALTALSVLVFAAAHQGWEVALVGDSVRWAGACMLVLGIATCALGSPASGPANRVLAALGVGALVLAVLTIATGSLTALSLLTLDVVALWAGSTLRHALRGREPLPAR